jgi:hypothetical protein
LGFSFKANAALLEKRNAVLTSQYETPELFLEFALPLLREDFQM